MRRPSQVHIPAPRVSFGQRGGPPSFLEEGGGGPVWLPYTDADLLGVWDPADGSDNGTTLTIPNRVSGGSSFTSTTGTRATLSATGIYGRPGVAMAGAPLTNTGVGALLAGRAGCTIIQTGAASATTAAYLHRYGTTADGDFRTLRSQPSSGRLALTLEAATNRAYAGEAGTPEYFWFPQVCCVRYGMATLEVPWVDAQPSPGTFSGTAPGGTMANRTLYWGSDTTGATAFPGVLGPLVLVGRVLTDAEIPVWTAWYAGLVAQTSWRQVYWTGDSITACNSVGGAQWRLELQSLITGGSSPSYYRATGQFSPSSTAFTLDYCNAGGGNTIATTTANLATYNYGTRYRSGPRAAVFPILLGTNDIAVSGLSNSAIATAYGTLLDTIVARLPGSRCIVQKLLPRGDASNAQVTDLNANYLPTVVSDAVGRGIDCLLDDTFATMGGITYLDAVHPDAASGVAMAAAIEPVLRGWCA